MTTTLKIDVDVPELKKDESLFRHFIRTRHAILRELGYTVQNVRWAETEKGYHFWITIEEQLDDKKICDLQFLLGDDHVRCRFNYLRLEADCFKQFNVLFNGKLKNNREPKRGKKPKNSSR